MPWNLTAGASALRELGYRVDARHKDENGGFAYRWRDDDRRGLPIRTNETGFNLTVAWGGLRVSAPRWDDIPRVAEEAWRARAPASNVALEGVAEHAGWTPGGTDWSYRSYARSS